ncbi:hypothetical protein HG536_0A06320 [Torulaspora globosa]|uniref:Uncharacterized protein n=1 Tax=Torulaspora globosa TaxID=48254 RepID=A0A7G3ZBD1_9SACH|nr:uncharacterized protein HG536_0A06320 [Torulaspora globosa]QLL30817.1 hypothetical protein HG536_0A06320 [Torulaspora globosa]
MVWELVRSWFDSLWFKISSVFLFQKELSIAIIGLQNSGKTTLIRLLGGKPFETDTVPTLGIQVSHFSLENNLIKVYDLAGQTRFQPLWERCFDKVDLIIYMIDLSDTMTLNESLQKLVKVIQMANGDRIPLLIVGNKTDLVADPKDPLPLGPLQAYNPDNWEKLKLDSTNAHLLKNPDILSRQIGVDLAARTLHVPLQSSEPPANESNAQGPANDTKQLPLHGDIAVLTVSCKDGSHIADVIDWIVQL